MERLKVPVYTVAMGDTTPQRDLLVADVRANDVAYLGNTFPVEADVRANRAAGMASTFTISLVSGNTEAVVYREAIAPSSNAFSKPVSARLEAKAMGVAHYRLRIAPIAGEVTTANNTRDVFVEVLNGKNRVLIAAASPHPDLGTLRTALLAKQNTDVTLAYADNLPTNLKGVDLLILHGLPGGTADARPLLTAAAAANVPVWFIATRQSNFAALNAAQQVVQLQARSGTFNEVQALVEPSFSLFQLAQGTTTLLAQLPPLDAPLGNASANASAVLLRQKIGAIATPLPLFAFGGTPSRKQALLLGEGLWRWRLEEYKQTKSNTATNELIAKTVQYLTLRTDRKPFKARPDKRIYDENEPILFGAELYNKSFEPVNTPDVQLTLTAAGGRVFRYQFSKTGTGYSLNAGTLPPATYQYEAKTAYDGNAYVERGSIAVRALQLETQATTADHALLALLAQKTGGRLVYPREAATLATLIKARTDVRPIAYRDEQVAEVINLGWLFFALVGLLGLEWFWRKFSGGY